MILALGKASGRKSSSQHLPDSGCVHVFLAVPFRPWTATRLAQVSAVCAGACIPGAAHTRPPVPKTPRKPRALDRAQRAHEVQVQSRGEDSNLIRISVFEVPPQLVWSCLCCLTFPTPAGSRLLPDRVRLLRMVGCMVSS